MARAVAHGLYECIERDAIARAFETHGFFDRMRIASSWSRSGGRGPVWTLRPVGAFPSASGTLRLRPALPSSGVRRSRPGAGEPILALPTEGYAAGPDIQQAASSALREALATRAGAISGAREDQSAGHYRKRFDSIVAKARQLILDQPVAAPRIETSAISGLKELLGRTAEAGLGPVLAVPIASDSECGVHCVRIILAGGRPFSIVR